MRLEWITITLSALLVFGTAAASTLSAQTQYVLKKGDALRVPISVQHLAGDKIELTLNTKVEGARISVESSGEIWVDWKAPDSDTGEYSIVVNAIDLTSKEIIESRKFLITVEETLPPRLGPFSPQKLIAGVDWQFFLDVKNIDRKALQILASGMPPRAELKREENGIFTLNWTPDPSQLGLHEIRLKALDQNDILHSTETMLSLFVIPGERPLSRPVELSATIEPIANQVISAGRILSLPISATTNDDALAVLQVDRLPANASFDINLDGSRTFYWQTSDRDQGEHVFRFTAFHPDNAEGKVSQEVLIIVGDPTRNTSLPVTTDQ